MAKTRNLPRAFAATHYTAYDNLLVSGCSYTFNNSEHHVCSWPYYLRDLANFKMVYDCSQPAVGSNHIFNSIVNEIETNANIMPTNNFVCVMWSGLTRTDVIVDQEIIKSWPPLVDKYKFNDKFSSLSIHNGCKFGGDLGTLCRDYKKLVDTDAQIYESVLKIVALENYLQNKGFAFLFLGWMDLTPELDRITTSLKQRLSKTFTDFEFLDHYAGKDREPDGHPTPNAYLGWTQNHLLPYLKNQGIAHCIKS